jgi:hypothetical protein
VTDYPLTPWTGGPGGEPVLVDFGDVQVTATTVYTPVGSAPVGQTSFSFTDMSRTTQTIPAWAIVCAIVFAIFCLLGLLFLLAKEERTDGWVQIVVRGPHLFHTVQLPVYSVHQVWDANARVNHARSISAGAW